MSLVNIIFRVELIVLVQGMVDSFLVIVKKYVTERIKFFFWAFGTLYVFVFASATIFHM